MIKGIGCDIVNIDRVANLINQYGDHFKCRIFTKSEIEKAPQGANEASYYAKRFAAKESLAKALGFGIGLEIAFTDIEIQNDARGAPIVTCNKMEGCKIHISLSDDMNFAIAYVIIEKLL